MGIDRAGLHNMLAVVAAAAFDIVAVGIAAAAVGTWLDGTVADVLVSMDMLDLEASAAALVVVEVDIHCCMVADGMAGDNCAADGTAAYDVVVGLNTPFLYLLYPYLYPLRLYHHHLYHLYLY